MRIIHILPHAMEPFADSLETISGWAHFEHHSTRFIQRLLVEDKTIVHELWVLSSKQKNFLYNMNMDF
jgi:hypothetical protein